MEADTNHGARVKQANAARIFVYLSENGMFLSEKQMNYIRGVVNDTWQHGHIVGVDDEWNRAQAARAESAAPTLIVAE